MIYELEDNEKFEYDEGKHPRQIMDFSPELINMISKCDPIGITELSDVVQAALADINQLKQQADTTDTWKKDVQRLIENITRENSQTTHNIAGLHKSIEGLWKSIETETMARKTTIAEVEKKVDRKMITLQTLGYIITTVLIGGGGTLLVGWLTGLINFG